MALDLVMGLLEAPLIKALGPSPELESRSCRRRVGEWLLFLGSSEVVDSKVGYPTKLVPLPSIISTDPVTLLHHRYNSIVQRSSSNSHHID
ncbi:hypothetical protein VNO77_03601 [Canavalia gladiata]|uniref:Uncharacterized protein n=1 Tax=Canavalia gladiata TaxID=3824 RepID=A0AAN9R6Z5_CANGL